MIEQRKDWDLLVKVTEGLRDSCSLDMLKVFFDDPNSYMFVEDNNVGLAVCDYNGLYTVHWYFEKRGREAINLAKQMIANLFVNYGAKAVRGLIKEHMKASRWACRQVGLKSLGFITFADGDVNEIFAATKDEFLKESKEWVV